MAGARLEKTKTPGIFRRGAKYVVVYRVNGKQRRETARTLEDARRLKRSRETDRDRGKLGDDGRVPFREYAEEWIGRYQGNGRRGFSDDTRQDYRRDLKRYAYPFLDAKLGRTVATISPRDVASWIGWLCDEKSQGRHLADATVRRIVAPVRACLATARREGLITANPASEAVLPRREESQVSEEEDARAMSREELEMFLRVVHPERRLLFRFLAATGVRWGEAAALRWSDLTLDGSEPCVSVKRALGRHRKADEAPVFKAPKSRYGRRTIPLPHSLVPELRRARGDAAGDALVFAAVNGAPMRQENVRRRVLAPAAEEAGVPWIGFHSFRHTCASLLFARGKNAKQVQRWLGHHQASFTLDTYAHLLDDGVGDPLDLDVELQGDNEGTTHQPETGRNPRTDGAENLALATGFPD